ncbi:hypothetical protein P43SY_006342 [Pythium insidiosum]|uniref:ZSWIM1/3 RNaseH-like domain-containing protein n=1 Tax=Pythium insidiosum TaxID=114742 RepID=A0AAD5Q5Q6_PYTIN|nr:hypothetical protein P43SY_006342 [Pythium insidiosum]
MSTAQASLATRRSQRIAAQERPIYVFNRPRKPKSYYVYSIYDRDAADPEWYWVKWFGFKDDRHDTAQHRDNLARDGFGDLCDYVDAFKEWEAEAEDGEVRTHGSSASSSMSSAGGSVSGSAAGSPRRPKASDAADVRRSPRIQSKPPVRYVTRTRKAEERAGREASRLLESLFDDDDEAGDDKAGASKSTAEEEEASMSSDEEEEAGEEAESDADDVGGSSMDVHDSSKIRPRMVETSTEAVSVEAPQRFHKDWPSWWEYKKAYEEATFQVIRVTETLGVKTRNERARNTKAAREGLPIVEFPESMDPFRRVFICTHGWKPKTSRVDKNSGKRPRQHIRFTGCPFRFVIQVVKNGSEWQLEVTNGTYYHNHRVSKEVFQTYPSSRGIKDPNVKAVVSTMIECGTKRSRGIKDPNVKAVVSTMIECGTKRSKIYDYLLDRGENVIRSDVDNMISAFKARTTTKNDDDDTAIVLARFAADHDGNAVTVDETSRGETGVISLSSHHMRVMYERFPELLLVDCTHKTNRWMKIHVDVPPVRAFQYNEFAIDVVSKRTKAERYRAALSVSQAMSSEMAEIEDEKEFEGYLADMIQQWRNVRQRKRVRPAIQADNNIDDQLAEVQLSQANSLYCSDLGDVAMLDTQDVHIAEPKSQVVIVPLEKIAECDDERDDHGQVLEDHGPVMDETQPTLQTESTLHDTPTPGGTPTLEDEAKDKPTLEDESETSGDLEDIKM